MFDGNPVFVSNCNWCFEILQFIHSADEFDVKTPEGGCSLPCQTRLNCGHVCRKTCHAYDPKHEKVQCKEDCERLCQNGHKCPNKCYQVGF